MLMRDPARGLELSSQFFIFYFFFAWLLNLTCKDGASIGVSKSHLQDVDWSKRKEE